MAPCQSRIAGGSRRAAGLGLLASGAFAGSQLFVAPRGPPQAGPRGTAPVVTQAEGAVAAAAAPTALGNVGSSLAPTALAGLLLAGAGLIGNQHKASGRARPRTPASAAAVAAAEDYVPPPFEPAEQVGAVAPLGYFDPLGFTKTGDEEGFRKMREAELKHGRVAMMASVGLVGQHFIKFPFFEKTPAGFGALYSGEGVLGFFGLFVLSGIMELAWRSREDREPGNFGDPFGVNMYNEEMRNKEINNGRFAMICVFGIFAAEMASGKDAMQQFGL